METKVEKDEVLVKLPCQMCKKKTWFKYQAKNGYICRDCKDSTVPYWYIRCNRCRRIFYGNNHNAKTCIRCVYCLRRPKRRIRAIRPDRLIEGELFYCIEFPFTVFMKSVGGLVLHLGDDRFDLEIVKDSVNIYKYIPEG